jgi:NADH:quinone reductase (non-electrogenic)
LTAHLDNNDRIGYIVKRPQVVIIGGGFGGLTSAKALRGAGCDITLIDKQNHHCFQPLLYQVATAALSPADIAWPIRSILSSQLNVRVVMGRVEEIDRLNRLVRTSEGQDYSFDFLVIATGATHSYLLHPEWSMFAPGLKRIEDAVEIRRRVLLSFEQAEIEEDQNKRLRLMTFVVIGAGPTGVELAGVITETARYALSRDFRRIDPRAAKFILVEAGSRILPGFPATLSSFAHRALQAMGVEIRTDTLVTGMDGKSIATSRGGLEAACVLWAAGVKASPAAQWLNVAADRAGRVSVLEDLSVPDEPNVFVIGDTASACTADGLPIPGIAPAAKQMGKYVAAVVRARLNGKHSVGPFRYRHSGDLATIGRKAAIVSIGRLRLTGFPAWIFWSVAHIYFLIGARNRIVVAFDWLWDYITFQRGARLIHGDSLEL